jgi:hypothetical protein
VGRLRLELDIDADVYPELHATLTSLVSDASRGERLRQLAAAGLVWEKLRIRGQAALHGVAPDSTHAAPLAPFAAVPAVAPAPAPRAARSSSGRAPAAARGPAPAPVPVPVAPPRSAPAGFVDLALDAAPEAQPVPPPPLAAPAVPAPAVAQHWPPVLMDVVEPEAFATAIPVPKSDDRPSRPVPLAPQLSPPAPPPQRPSQPVPVRLVDEAPELAPPDPPIEHRSSTRSRLLRMKEKGLFKNG